MTWEEYRLEAWMTWNWKITGQDAIEYICDKLIEEFAEILGEHTKYKFHGKKPDYLKEFGDAMWYIAALSNNEFTGRMYSLDTTNPGVKYDVRLNCKDSIRDLLDWGEADFNGPTDGCILQRLWDSLVEMVNQIGFTLGEIWEANIIKIRIRHGEKYNPEHYKGV